MTKRPLASGEGQDPLDLDAVHSPLRHYRVEADHGDYVFTHRTTGLRLRVAGDDAQHRWRTTPSADVFQVFEGLLPPLCFGCGQALMGDAPPLCVDCESRQIDELLGILSGPSPAPREAGRVPPAR